MNNENTQGNIEEGRKLEITEETRSVENQSRESAACFSAKAIERFWSKVNKNGPTQPHMSSPCWQWIAAKRKGYGTFKISGKSQAAHRVSLTLAIGGIPEGLVAMHDCDNPACVNPSHLRAGTSSQNAIDSFNKGRKAIGDNHHTRARPECTARGERVAGARLTARLVRDIRESYASGRISYKSIAFHFGVSNATIQKVISRKSWAHIA